MQVFSVSDYRGGDGGQLLMIPLCFCCTNILYDDFSQGSHIFEQSLHIKYEAFLQPVI